MGYLKMTTRGDLPAATRKHPTVKRPSNCSACHQPADPDNDDERDIRIPR